MKIKKLMLIFFLTILTSSMFNCYCQLDMYDISGSWTATKGELISSLCNGEFEIKGINISGLRFSFDKKTLKLNKTFKWYSTDSIYNYIFIDTIPKNRHFWNNIRIKLNDKNNIIIEMQYLGGHIADRVMWYDIYLKRE